MGGQPKTPIVPSIVYDGDQQRADYNNNSWSALTSWTPRGTQSSFPVSSPFFKASWMLSRAYKAWVVTIELTWKAPCPMKTNVWLIWRKWPLRAFLNFICCFIWHRWIFCSWIARFSFSLNLICSLKVPPDYLLLDRSPNIGPLISHRWERDKFRICWNKSFRTPRILTLLYQQFSN